MQHYTLLQCDSCSSKYYDHDEHRLERPRGHGQQCVCDVVRSERLDMWWIWDTRRWNYSAKDGGSVFSAKQSSKHTLVIVFKRSDTFVTSCGRTGVDEFNGLTTRISGTDGWYVTTIVVQDDSQTVTFHCNFDLDHYQTRSCYLWTIHNGTLVLYW